MRGDLNEQFQRAQAVTDNGGPRKWLIALIIGFLVMFLVVIILGTVFIVNTFDKFVDSEPGASSGTSNYTENPTASGGFDPFNPTGGGSQTVRPSREQVTEIPIEYGTVTGTSYFSSFSGVSFSAPSDWSVTSAGGENFLSAMNSKDLSASSANLSSNVGINYKSSKSLTYKSAADTIADYKADVQGMANGTILDDDVSATYGGNRFSGIIYKKTVDENFAYYTEILVTELKGYIMEIYVETNSQEELNSIMGMFK